MDVSADNTMMAFVGDRVLLLDLERPEVRQLESTAFTVKFHPGTSRLLATTHGDKVTLINTEVPSILGARESQDFIFSLTWNADGSQIIVVGRQCFVWDVTVNRTAQVTGFDDGEIDNAIVSPDGAYLVLHFVSKGYVVLEAFQTREIH